MRQEVRRQAELGVDWIKLYHHVPTELVQAAVSEAHEFGLPVVGHMGARKLPPTRSAPTRSTFGP